VLGGVGSTFGYRIFVGAFLATALVAATSVARRPATYLGVVVIASGLAVTTTRSAWIGAIGGLVIVLWRHRDRRFLVSRLIPVIVVVLTAWTLADVHLPGASGPSFVSRFAHIGIGTGLERLPLWSAFARAWAGDPIFGSGPQTTWHPYLVHASADQIRVVGRFADSHNVLLEMGTTTGTVGALAFVGLFAFVVVRALRAPRDRAWALGALSSLLFFHTVEPMNPGLTPLMFLLAGLAMSDPGPTRRIDLRRWAAVPLAVGLAAVTADVAGATMEQRGRSRRSESALRSTLLVAPWRIRPAVYLAEMRIEDFRRGDESGRTEAHRLAFASVRRHGWYPEARIDAADVEAELGDVASALRLLEDQLRIFPRDPVAKERREQLSAQR
jgi:hypothetical protein